METPDTNDQNLYRRDRRIAGVATATLLFLLCFPATPGDLPGRFDHLLPEHFDKWVHVGLFAGESLLLHRWLRHGVGSLQASPVATTWVAATVLALMSEGIQHFVPGRFTDASDVVADLVGVLLWSVAHLALRSRPALLKSS